MSFSQPVFTYANLFSPGEQTKFKNMTGWQKNLLRKITNVLTHLAVYTAIAANQLRFCCHLSRTDSSLRNGSTYLSQLTVRRFPEEQTGAPEENPGF